MTKSSSSPSIVRIRVLSSSSLLNSISILLMLTTTLYLLSKSITMANGDSDIPSLSKPVTTIKNEADFLTTTTATTTPTSTLSKSITIANDDNDTPAQPKPLAMIKSESNDDNHVTTPPKPITMIKNEANDDNDTPTLPKAVTMIKNEANNDNDTPTLPKAVTMIKNEANNDNDTPTLPKAVTMIKNEANNDNDTPPLPKAVTMIKNEANNDNDTPTLPKAVTMIKNEANNDNDTPTLLKPVTMIKNETDFLTTTTASATTTTPTSTRLANNRLFPLITIDIDNVEKENIPTILSKTIMSNPDSQNEMISVTLGSIDEQIVTRTITTSHPGREYHVMIKVWYTHLGYERTKLSLTTYLNNLLPHHPHIKIHIVLASPRCDEDVSPTTCQNEEDALPRDIKNAGPSPLENSNDAYLDSWRALEELYVRHPPITSIGVAHFSTTDWKRLLKRCRIVPHFHRCWIHSYFDNDALMPLLSDNEVLFIATNVWKLMTSSLARLPNIETRLREHAINVGVDSATTMIVAWFLQNDVGVVINANDYLPSSQIKKTNWTDVVGNVPSLATDYDYLKTLLHHALRDEDVHVNSNGHVVVSFVNKLDKDVRVYWVNEEEDGTLRDVTNVITAEGAFDMGSHPGHVFVVKHDGEEGEEGEVVKRFEVTAERGGRHEFYIDEL